MATAFHSLRYRGLPLALLLALSFALPALVQAQVLVIANPGISATAISKAELHDVFTGASTSLNGTQVTPVLLQGGVHNAFLSLYIGKSDSGFRAGWRSILFSGQGMMPRTLDSDADVVAFVERMPGAIGYISSDSPHKGVRVLAVR